MASPEEKTAWRMTDYLAIISPIAVLAGSLLTYQSSATRTEVNINHMTFQIKDFKESLDKLSIRMEAQQFNSDTRLRQVETTNSSQQTNIDALNRTFLDVAAQNREVMQQLISVLRITGTSHVNPTK